MDQYILKLYNGKDIRFLFKNPIDNIHLHEPQKMSFNKRFASLTSKASFTNKYGEALISDYARPFCLLKYGEMPAPEYVDHMRSVNTQRLISKDKQVPVTSFVYPSIPNTVNPSDRLRYIDVNICYYECKVKPEYAYTLVTNMSVYYEIYLTDTRVLMLTTREPDTTLIDKFILPNTTPDIYEVASVPNAILIPDFNAYALIKEKNIHLLSPDPMPDVDVVVARYNENIDWVFTLPDHAKPIIYDKSNKCECTSCHVRCTACIVKSKKDYVYLGNYGRESHTYLWHIVNNYDTLAEYTIFSQGDPSEHMTNYKDRLSALTKMSNYDVACANLGTYDLGDGKLRHIGKWKDEYVSGNMKPCDLSFTKWAEHHIGIQFKTPAIQVTWNGMFAVHRSTIKNLPKVYYYHLLKQLNHINPEEGHYLERLWLYIFKQSKCQLITY